jgi:hypothetical protein
LNFSNNGIFQARPIASAIELNSRFGTMSKYINLILGYTKLLMTATDSVTFHIYMKMEMECGRNLERKSFQQEII